MKFPRTFVMVPLIPLMVLSLFAALALIFWLRALFMLPHNERLESYQISVPWGWETISAYQSGLYIRDSLRFWTGSELVVDTDSRKDLPFPNLTNEWPLRRIRHVGTIDVNGVTFDRVYWSDQEPTEHQAHEIFGPAIRGPFQTPGEDFLVGFEYKTTKDEKIISIMGSCDGLNPNSSISSVEHIASTFKQLKN